MSVKLRCGRFIVDTIWPDGIRTRSSMPDEQTAGRINKKIEVAIVDENRIWRRLRRELRLEAGSVTTFRELADRYLKQYVSSYNRDIRGKTSRITVLETFFRDHPIQTMGPFSVSRFITSRKSKGAKNATINRDLSVLGHIMTWAARQGILEESPLGHIEKLKEPEWIGERPDDAVLDGIFARLDTTVLPIFVFLRETGCRRAEAISVTPSQVDYSRAAVTFHGETKSGRARQVPLTDQALWAVQALPVYGPTVFYHPTYLKPFTGDGLGWLWDQARGSSKLRIHDLRHAFAIRLAEEGCPMHYISEVMGHHSIDFTRKRYARFSPESASKAVLRVLEGRKAAGAAMAQKWHGG